MLAWRTVALFLAGILIFADARFVATLGVIATITLLLAIGVVARRWRAMGWSAILIASALVADLLWQVDWAPFNRSNDYEALPQTPFVLVGLPIPMAVVAAGIGARALWRHFR